MLRRACLGTLAEARTTAAHRAIGGLDAPGGHSVEVPH